HAIAAGARFRAVVVVDAHIGVSAGRARGMQRHELVIGDAPWPGGGARLGGADRARLRAQVDHHDLVAEAVHLDEGAVGERAHGDLARVPYMGNCALLASGPKPNARSAVSLTGNVPAAISMPW